MVSFEVEAWIWYGCAITVVIFRFLARSIQFKSIKKLQPEDALMALAAALYTAEIVLLIKAAVTPTNLIPPDQVDKLSHEDVQLRIYGSKLIVALEQVYCATIWSCKGCILLMCATLTYGLRQYRFVQGVAVYTFVGYVVMVILYFAVWCRPFYNYWSLPAADPQCSTAMHHLILNFVINVSSDLMIWLIPIPLFIRSNLPLKKKFLVTALFSFGLFGIVSAVLNKYYSFTEPYGSSWVYWYCREASTFVIVANLPHCWSLVRRIFNLPSFIQGTLHGTNPTNASRGQYGGNPDYHMSIGGGSVMRSRNGSAPLSPISPIDGPGARRSGMIRIPSFSSRDGSHSSFKDDTKSDSIQLSSPRRRDNPNTGSIWDRAHSRAFQDIDMELIGEESRHQSMAMPSVVAKEEADKKDTIEESAVGVAIPMPESAVIAENGRRMSDAAKQV